MSNISLVIVISKYAKNHLVIFGLSTIPKVQFIQVKVLALLLIILAKLS